MLRHLNRLIFVVGFFYLKVAVAATSFLNLPFSDPTVKIQNSPIYFDDTEHWGGGYPFDYIKGDVDNSLTWTTFEARAAGSGVAIQSYQNGYGNFVLIRHDETDEAGRSVYTLYAHLDSVNSVLPNRSRYDTDYTKWKRVEAGAFLGMVGSTGKVSCATKLSSCVHLHFEVFRGGYFQNAIDPYNISSVLGKFKRDLYPDISSPGCGSDYFWKQCPPPVAAKTYLAANYLTFREGNPEFPGDNIRIFSGGDVADYMFTNPIDFDARLDVGTTSTFFYEAPPGILSDFHAVAIANGSCVADTTGTTIPAFIFEITVSGVVGYSVNTTLAHKQEYLRLVKESCGPEVLPDDIQWVGINVRTSEGVPIPLDAFAFGYGLDNVPNGSDQNIVSVLFEDNFEPYTLGTFPSSGNWYIRTGGAGNQLITDIQSTSGTQSFRVEGSSGLSADILRDISVESNIISLEADVYTTRDDSRNASIGIVIDGVGAALAIFYPGGVVGPPIKDSVVTLLGSYTVNRWYKLRVEINQAAESYRMFIDGIMIGENLELNGGLAGQGDNVRLFVANNLVSGGGSGVGGGTVAYFDNVVVTTDSPVLFADSFDRPNSSVVGNGWSNLTDGGDIELSNSEVKASEAGPAYSGIYRSVDYEGDVTIGAKIKETNGYSGLLRRYVAGIGILGDGTSRSGYEVFFVRSDSAINNSQVQLQDGGTIVDSVMSTFQYGPEIDVEITFKEDGSITGGVSGDSETFLFEFPSREVTSDGEFMYYEATKPDTRRTSTLVLHRMDNFTVTGN